MRIEIVLAASLCLAACGSGRPEIGNRIAGGDANQGSAAIFRYGCGSCHTIQGIENARGLVGPPLTGIGDRIFIAGMLPNTPTNLTHWIEDPKSVNEKTAMPKLGVTEQDAVNIAAYLYSLP